MKKITTLIIALLAGITSWAQCSADFYSYNNGNNNDVAFYAVDSNQTGTYTWDMGDSTVMTTITGEAFHTYGSPGLYFACLTFDGSGAWAGCTITSCDSVFVGNTPPPPTCDASFGISNSQGSMNVNLYAYDSTQTGSYVWSMGDGSEVTSTNGFGVYSYASNGTYSVCCTFDDGMGCADTYCDSVVIGNTPPPSSCSADFYSYNNGNSNDVAFYAVDSNQTGTYTWDMGDNTLMTTTTGEAFYTYGSPGLYFACLTFDDGMGCTDTYCDSVFVGNTPPPSSCSAGFYWWQAYDSINNSFSSNVYLVNMATGANLTYSWSFGDGNTSSQQYPTHTYAQIGSYGICLSIDNGNGCTDTFCDTISVVVKSSGFTLNVISESEVASVGIENEEVIGLTSLYPNPVNESATLEFNATQNTNVDVTIIDISGKQVNNFSTNVNSGNNKIAVGTSDLANGYYMLNISSKDGGLTKTIRFAKQ